MPFKEILSEEGIELGKFAWGHHELPEGSSIIGLVQTWDFRVGALIQFQGTGIKLLGNMGNLTSLPIIGRNSPENLVRYQ
jgi:alpha-D-ribose 1-methylphosphonate 5-triphosphate synthase subunit PhnH